VIGVEGLEQPILDFFKEQSLEYVKESTGNGFSFSVNIYFEIFFNL